MSEENDVGRCAAFLTKLTKEAQGIAKTNGTECKHFGWWDEDGYHWSGNEEDREALIRFYEKVNK